MSGKNTEQGKGPKMESLADIAKLWLESITPQTEEEAEAYRIQEEKEAEERREAEKEKKRRAEIKWKTELLRRSKLVPDKIKFADLSMFPEFKFVKDRDYKFTGDMGTGKTLLAHAIAKVYLNEKQTVLFLDKFTVIDMAMKIYRFEVSIDFLMTETALLILDDFGQVELTPNQLKLFNYVIGERAEYGLRTIITGNFSIEDLLEDTTLERFKQNVQFVNFSGVSKRPASDFEDVKINR